jgi:hypothetical protein
VLGDREVVALEQPRRLLVGIEVELVDQQHVGARALDDLRDVAQLRIGAGLQVGDELPRDVAIDGRVEGREAQRPVVLAVVALAGESRRGREREDGCCRDRDPRDDGPHDVSFPGGCATLRIAIGGDCESSATR